MWCFLMWPVKQHHQPVHIICSICRQHDHIICRWHEHVTWSSVILNHPDQGHQCLLHRSDQSVTPLPQDSCLLCDAEAWQSSSLRQGNSTDQQAHDHSHPSHASTQHEQDHTEEKFCLLKEGICHLSAQSERGLSFILRPAALSLWPAPQSDLTFWGLLSLKHTHVDCWGRPEVEADSERLSVSFSQDSEYSQTALSWRCCVWAILRSVTASQGEIRPALSLKAPSERCCRAVLSWLRDRQGRSISVSVIWCPSHQSWIDCAEVCSRGMSYLVCVKQRQQRLRHHLSSCPGSTEEFSLHSVLRWSWWPEGSVLFTDHKSVAVWTSDHHCSSHRLWRSQPAQRLCLLWTSIHCVKSSSSTSFQLSWWSCRLTENVSLTEPHLLQIHAAASCHDQGQTQWEVPSSLHEDCQRCCSSSPLSHSAIQHWLLLHTVQSHQVQWVCNPADHSRFQPSSVNQLTQLHILPQTSSHNQAYEERLTLPWRPSASSAHTACLSKSPQPYDWQHRQAWWPPHSPGPCKHQHWHEPHSCQVIWGLSSLLLHQVQLHCLRGLQYRWFFFSIDEHRHHHLQVTYTQLLSHHHYSYSPHQITSCLLPHSQLSNSNSAFTLPADDSTSPSAVLIWHSKGGYIPEISSHCLQVTFNSTLALSWMLRWVNDP